MQQVPLKGLLIDVMNLHLWALLGAAVGLIFGVTWVCWSKAARMLHARRQGEPDEADDFRLDADQIIQARRNKKAEDYLSKRQAERKRLQPH